MIFRSRSFFTSLPAAILLYLVIGFAIFGSSFSNDFLLDDQQQIIDNPFVHKLASWPAHFSNSTMATGNQLAGIYYKPLMMITYSAVWNIFGPQPNGFHIVQLLLHITNCLLIFILFSKIFKLNHQVFFISLFAGLIYLCHPINSEAVLFAADMQEPLYTFFGLSALVTIASSRSTMSMAAAAALLLCSLLSKESGLQYVVAYFAFAALFHREQIRKISAFIAVVIISYLTLRMGVAGLTSVLAHEMKIAQADLLTRLISVPKILAHYIYLFVFPKDISITQDWVVNTLSLNDFWLPLLAVSIVFAIIFFQILKHRSQNFIFFSVWFFCGWGLHSQIVPLDGTVSDRWFYFTMIGLIGIIFSFKFQKFKFSKKLAVTFSVIALTILSYRTYLRTFDWQTPMTLFQKDLQVEPNSFYLNNNLGLGYLAKGQYEQSISYFKKTIEVSNKKSRVWYVGWTNLGSAYLFRNQLENAEAALRIAAQSGDIKSYRALSGTYLAMQKNDEFDAITAKALLRYPDDAVILKLIATQKDRKR